MNIGDYCRDEKGNIDKIIDRKEITEHYEIGGATSYTYTKTIFENDRIKSKIIKSSPNIIDLIEVGDILEIKDMLGNISKVEVDENFKLLSGTISAITTHEQYETNKYKIGE